MSEVRRSTFAPTPHLSTTNTEGGGGGSCQQRALPRTDDFDDDEVETTVIWNAERSKSLDETSAESDSPTRHRQFIILVNPDGSPALGWREVTLEPGVTVDANGEVSISLVRLGDSRLRTAIAADDEALQALYARGAAGHSPCTSSDGQVEHCQAAVGREATEEGQQGGDVCSSQDALMERMRARDAALLQRIANADRRMRNMYGECRGEG